jgi:hypothetical protein
LLESFADDADSAAVHLKAANMPRQATKVLLPIPSMKENEVYAPSMNNGERVALVRFPHGGTFEIPQLTVNNRNPDAIKLLGSTARDAIGINHKVAERLSGADFDGDTVLVIPNNRGSIKSTPALEGLRGFDPHASFPPHDGMKTIDGGIYNAKTKRVDYQGRQPRAAGKQQEMGKITNLIADMTIKGANPEEVARAVRHSMVVIDAEKHNLDFKASASANNIPQLKEKYQGRKNAGAATFITKGGSEKSIPERTPRPAAKGGPIDPVTGRKVFEDTGRLIPERTSKIDPITGRRVYTNTGRMIPKMESHERLAITENAHSLLSDTPTRMEVIYADHSNRLKALANDARKEAVATRTIPYSPSAKRVYADEVAKLTAGLNLAQKNAPLERQAQVIANAIVSQKRQANPGMDSETLKKIKNQALNEARIRTGAQRYMITITPAEWAAIQAGAISNHMLEKILTKADLDSVKKLATPKVQPKMTSTQIGRASSMLDSGYTQAEVAKALGVSVSTLQRAINE